MGCWKTARYPPSSGKHLDYYLNLGDGDKVDPVTLKVALEKKAGIDKDHWWLQEYSMSTPMEFRGKELTSHQI